KRTVARRSMPRVGAGLNPPLTEEPPHRETALRDAIEHRRVAALKPLPRERDQVVGELALQRRGDLLARPLLGRRNAVERDLVHPVREPDDAVDDIECQARIAIEGRCAGALLCPLLALQLALPFLVGRGGLQERDGDAATVARALDLAGTIRRQG